MTHSQPGVRSLSRWAKSLVCFGTLVTCFIVCLCSDGASGWQQTTGPPGGRVNCVAVDIDEPAIVYAGLGELGIYRSTDGGTTWEPSKAQMGGVDRQHHLHAARRVRFLRQLRALSYDGSGSFMGSRRGCAGNANHRNALQPSWRHLPREVGRGGFSTLAATAGATGSMLEGIFRLP